MMPFLRGEKVTKHVKYIIASLYTSGILRMSPVEDAPDNRDHKINRAVKHEDNF
jgi:hypothetical protein